MPRFGSSRLEDIGRLPQQVVNSGDLPSLQAGFSRISINPKLVFREVGKLDVSFDDCWME